MKNLVLSLMFAGFGMFACQTTQPPEDVSGAFMKKFENAEDVRWDQEKENEWEAEFMLGGKQMSACFDNSGNWLESETAISKDELPASIMDSLHLKFEGCEIEESFNIEKIDFTGYEILISQGTEKFEVLMNPDGEISDIKEAEKIDNEEDEE